MDTDIDKESVSAAVNVVDLSAPRKPEVRDVVDSFHALSLSSSSLSSTSTSATAALHTAPSAHSNALPSFSRLGPVPVPVLCALNGFADVDGGSDVLAFTKRLSPLLGAGTGEGEAAGGGGGGEGREGETVGEIAGEIAGEGAVDKDAVTGAMSHCMSSRQYPTSRAPQCDIQADLSKTVSPVDRRQLPYSSVGDRHQDSAPASASAVPTGGTCTASLNQQVCEVSGAHCDAVVVTERALLDRHVPPPLKVKGEERNLGAGSDCRLLQNTAHLYSTKCPLCTYENEERGASTDASFCSVCGQDLRGAVHTPVAVPIPLATPSLTVLSSLR